jgi:murein DD-endopeptidase MepM/ murein hydrolase activator NlpD
MSAQGPFKACPVQDQFSVSDGFGAPRYAGGYHPHAGNDIIAQQYAPIVAPFDGVAEATPNTLGGNAVIVRGDHGYVYNAHLVAYGNLGPVHAGDVIGYVGNTGDAQGGPYHDHFEWHPYRSPSVLWRSPYGYTTVDSGTAPAVDPFPYLEQACPHT